ncbi:hypothetical protein C6496_10585 [Candidatus Poribacteria bacterium]|nr:MAG: hypothetical protein C6496_10585 [Candidatus Poribacteria bacterium]
MIGTANAAFENIELMAGPMGMGGAYAATTQDTSALIWNPAGLARLPVREIGIGYLDLYGLLNYSFIGVAYPIQTGQTLGAAILSSSDTEDLSYERIVLLSAATRLWKELQIGMSAKYFTTSVNLERMPVGHGSGWGVDFGVQSAFMREKVRVGVVFPNLLSNVSYRRLEEAAYTESILREWRIGTAVEIDVPNRESDTVLAAFELANGTPLVGSEYRYDTEQGAFAFRLGWRFIGGLTAGFGYQRGNVGLDYAFVSGRYVGSQSSLFSVRVFY